MSGSTGTDETSNPAADDGEWRNAWEEWEEAAYWQEIGDDTIVFCALVIMEASLLKSGYPDEIRKAIKKRIRVLVKRYDRRER